MTHKNRLAREVLVDNPWHQYCRDDFRQPDGSQGTYFYIDMPGSCGVIPLFEDGSTVLLKVDRYLLGCDLWEFPIGGMKHGEEPLDVAKKELAEEAGLVAERWQHIGSFAPYKGISNEHSHVFVAEELTWTQQQLEPSEAIEVHRMSVTEARQRLLDAPLPDGMALASLALFDRYRQE